MEEDLHHSPGQKVINRHEKLKGNRVNWDSHWDQVAKYVLPRKDNVYGQLTPGDKTGNELFNSEAILATDDLAAAMHSLLTNPQTMWFGLGTGNPELDKNENVKKWLFDSVLKMMGVLNSSNFNVEILETYTDLGSIGTTLLRMEEDEKDVIRFHSHTPYAVYVDENNKGEIDYVSREYEWDKRQILQEFGEEMSKKEIEELGEDVHKKWTIIHEVRPREEAEKEGEIGSKAMPWSSIHVLKETGLVLRTSGFEEFPHAVPRWTRINKELYGRSPAMKALSDIKMINSMNKVTIQGSQLRMGPPLQVPDSGFLTRIKMTPFSTNYYRAGSKDEVKPLFTAGDPGFGLDFIEHVQRIIRRAFLLDKLNIDVGDRATATEVIQKRDEQLRALGPLVGRLDRELLKRIVDRLFGIMLRRKLFDDIPEELGDLGELVIKYTSTIARSQLIVQSENIMRAINASVAVIQVQPEVMDNIDGDKLLRHNFTIYGVDPSILRSETDVEKLRAARQQAAQDAANQQATAAQADAINKVGAVANDGQET